MKIQLMRWLGVVAAASGGACAQPTSEAFFFSFTPTAEESSHTTGEGAWRYAARVDRPDPAIDLGVGVMLFAGGLANNLAWTAPGAYQEGGQTHRLTISGADTHDGDTMSRALVERGFTVLRYSSIREGDPLHQKDPAMAQVMGLAGTLRLAGHAYEALTERAGLEPGEVIVLGHSLGAARGVLASEGKALGYVLMAGAYASPTDARPSSEAAGALERLADGSLGLDDEQQARADADGDGVLAGWELAAWASIEGGGVVFSGEWLRGVEGDRWPSEVLGAGHAPVLAVWGSLDTMSYHGPRLSVILGADRLTTRYFVGLGHTLGEQVEEGGATLCGPIEGRVVEIVAGWCERVARGE